MSKVTVKKNLIIFHKPQEWEEIYHQIFVDFGIKMSVSYVLKRELGFTIRHQTGLVLQNPDSLKLLGPDWHQKYYYEQQIHLDFYSESALTWFQLKYLDRQWTPNLA